LELYIKGAQLGHAPAQHKLGACFEYGSLGCEVDPRRSIAWYSRAAEQSDPEAELALSGWYLTGVDGILPQSDTEAFLWGQKAAEKGSAKAEFALGYYFETGIGTAPNLVEAKRWYLRAAEQGQKRAMARLAELKRSPNGAAGWMGAGSSGGRRELQKQRRGGGGGKEDCIVMWKMMHLYYYTGVCSLLLYILFPSISHLGIRYYGYWMFGGFRIRYTFSYKRIWHFGVGEVGVFV
jgi:TPR repeat protein